MSDLTKHARVTAEAVRALKLGQVNAFKTGRETRFTILMNHAPSATEHRLKKLGDRVESHGYRVVSSSINDATLRVDCVRSEKTVGTVERIARDGDGSVLMLHGTASPGLWRIADFMIVNRDMLLLTQSGDEVVMWCDLYADGEPGRVCSFHNRTMRAID